MVGLGPTLLNLYAIIHTLPVPLILFIQYCIFLFPACMSARGIFRFDLVKNQFALRAVSFQGQLLMVVLIHKLAQLLRISCHVFAHLLGNLPHHSKSGLDIGFTGMDRYRIDITLSHGVIE